MMRGENPRMASVCVAYGARMALRMTFAGKGGGGA